MGLGATDGTRAVWENQTGHQNQCSPVQSPGSLESCYWCPAPEVSCNLVQGSGTGMALNAPCESHVQPDLTTGPMKDSPQVAVVCFTSKIVTGSIIG